MILNKKAAMFGLDARIALAIFGALSVITGAALFKAIGDAKATAVLTEMREFGKAWESYYLDTGSSLERNSTDNTNIEYRILKTKYIIEDPGVKGWKGPYMPLKTIVSNDKAYYSNGKHADLVYLDNDFGATSWGHADAWCASVDNCYIWSVRWYINNESIVTAIDNKVDGGDGAIAGNFRWSEYSIPTEDRFLAGLKIAPINYTKM